MLVLSRKRNEVIRINHDITIIVVEIRGDKVRLGFKAPPEVVIHREEVFESIRRGEERKPKHQENSDDHQDQEKASFLRPQPPAEA